MREIMETNLEKLSNLTFEGILIHENGIAIDFNLPFLKLFGYKREELLGKNIPQLIAPKKYHKAIYKSIKNNYSQPFEIEGIKKNGSVFPLKVEVKEIQSEDNKNLRVASFRDVTQRVEAEKALLTSEEKYKKLSNLTFEGVLIHDNGIAVDFNLSFLKLFGYKREELLGKNMPQLITPKKHHKAIYKSIKNNYSLPFEIEGVKKNGSVFPLEIEARTIEKEGNKTLRVTSFRDITHRKKVENLLLISEEKFELLLESSEDMITVHDLDGTYLYYNGPSCYALTKEDVLGKTPYDFFEKEKADILVNIIKSVGKTGISKKIEIELNWFDEMKWFSEYFYLMKGDKEKGERIVKVCQDITERKKVENENIKLYATIEENEKKFSDLFEKSGAAIFIFENGVNIDCNQAALDLFKFKTKEDALKTHPSEISPEFQPNGQSSEEKRKEMLKIVLKNKTHRFEWTHLKSNGEKFPAEIILITTNYKPNDITVYVEVRDVTDLKKGEKEIVKAKKKVEKSEKYLHNIINNMGDAVYVKDNQRKVILVNNAFFEIFEISKDDIIGKLHSQNTTPKELKKFDMIDKQVLSDGKESVSEERLITRDNKAITISTRKTRFIDDSGKKYLIGVTRDISQTRVVEKELILSKEKAEESDRLKTEFLNNMSHEIRTPMNGILGFSELLNGPDLDDNKRKNFVSIIQNSGNQLLRVIDDIIEISKLETKQVILKEDKVNLNDLLLELFSVFDPKAKESQISLHLERGLSDSNSVILLDSLKLHKVLNNLLENALKFTNEGKINFGYKLENNKLEFFVSDTGIGIPKGKNKIIFKRFSQADKELSKKVGGLGLGLSIAKENVMLLGGDINVESKMMRGSTFRFNIPFNPFISDIKIDNNKLDDEKEFTFLIVEDEEINFMFIEVLLLEKLKIDCRIIHAINGKEAVEICENNANIDLVLMDLKMPIMNGFEATRLIKEFRPTLPIIAQSAYTSEEDKEKAKDAGCNDFISKPIKKEILKKTINNFIKTNLKKG
jgi:PAS domain S-box-containing protein